MGIKCFEFRLSFFVVCVCFYVTIVASLLCRVRVYGSWASGPGHTSMRALRFSRKIFLPMTLPMRHVGLRPLRFRYFRFCVRAYMRRDVHKSKRSLKQHNLPLFATAFVVGIEGSKGMRGFWLEWFCTHPAVRAIHSQWGPVTYIVKTWALNCRGASIIAFESPNI